MNTLKPNRQRSLAACLLLITLLTLQAASQAVFGQSEPSFPSLTGRVVDQANLLSAEQTAQLDQKLAAHEAATSNQVVVVTVESLQGFDIAEYALRIGREWGIGTAEKDNGVLLVVAPKERKVRIEVGYGLEGALPDGLAGTIVRTNILPSFRESDYPAGIDNGVDAIMQAVLGEYSPPATVVSGKDRPSTTLEKFFPLIFIGFIALTQGLQRLANRRVANAAFPAGFVGLVLTIGSGNIVIGIIASFAIFALLYFMGTGGNGGSNNRRGGYIGGGRMGGGGGFSGGGGGFGGGGASGSW